MESFSKATKAELLSENAKVSSAFFFGLFVSSGSYDEEGNVEITTDLTSLFSFCKKNLKILLKKYEINENIDENIQNLESFKINNKIFYKICCFICTFNILHEISFLSFNSAGTAVFLVLLIG